MLCLFDEVLSTLNKGGTVLPSWNSVQYYSLIGKSKNLKALDIYKVAVNDYNEEILAMFMKRNLYHFDLLIPQILRACLVNTTSVKGVIENALF